jgi:peptidoglycan/xylan/chitin deacetylase (PgdA/CDA1 family)
LGASAYPAQVEPNQSLLRQLTGIAPRCVRPPDGRTSASVNASLQAHGLHVAEWTVDPRDWTGISAAEIVQRVTAKVRPGSVVIFHDRTHAAEALPALVSNLRSRGYRFATICQTSGPTPGSPL